MYKRKKKKQKRKKYNQPNDTHTHTKKKKYARQVLQQEIRPWKCQRSTRNYERVRAKYVEKMVKCNDDVTIASYKKKIKRIDAKIMKKGKQRTLSDICESKDNENESQDNDNENDNDSGNNDNIE